ncbi:MAG TPA: Ig-like domain repeat protein, partial [Thermoanaerobaculia bacterium]
TVTLTGSGLFASTCVLAPGVLGTSSCAVTATPSAAGTDTIGANFPASSAHLTSAASSGLTVNKAAASVVVTSLPSSPVFGQSITFSATVTVTAPGAGTPTGGVTFFDGATQLGMGTLSGGVATFSTSALSVAGHSITAVYAGDTNFTTGTSPTLPEAVGKSGSQTSVASNPNPSVFGQPATFTASVGAAAPGAGTPTGTVTFYDGGVAFGSAPTSAPSVTTAALAAGVHAISAVYGGDGNFTGSTSETRSQTVSPAGTATAVASSLNPSALGQSVSFTATVTSSAGVPTGTVTFLDGTTALGSATLSSGAASVATTALSVGAHPITAVYGGAPSFLGSTSAVLTQTVASYYTFTGFLSPMTTAGTLAAPTFSGTQHLGSGQPVKWKLQDSSGNYLSDLTTTQTLQAVAYAGGACSGQATGTAYLLYNPTVGAKGGSTFRYDPSTNQFIFNWNTAYSGGVGCYEVELTLNDGSPIKATIEKLQ